MPGVVTVPALILSMTISVYSLTKNATRPSTRRLCSPFRMIAQHYLHVFIICDRYAFFVFFSMQQHG